VDTLFVFFNGRPPLPSLPLHLQSMVGRNGLCSGYKSQRTRGNQGGRKKDRSGEEEERQNQGKILVHQPAAPRSITIVFVLNGEYWTEKQGRNHRTGATPGGERRKKKRGENWNKKKREEEQGRVNKRKETES